MKYILLIVAVLLFSACRAFNTETPVTIFFQGEVVHAVLFTPDMSHFRVEKCKYYGKDGEYCLLFNKKEKELRVLEDFVFRTYEEAEIFGDRNKQ